MNINSASKIPGDIYYNKLKEDGQFMWDVSIAKKFGLSDIFKKKWIKDIWKYNKLYSQYNKTNESIFQEN